MSKTKKSGKKIQYFHVDKFVESVIDAMELGSVKESIKHDLEMQIAQRLGDRVMFTVINSFRDRELGIFENVLNDHPELDEMDALWMVAHEVDGLKEKLEKEINSLYAELVYEAEKIGEVIKPAKETVHSNIK